MKIVDVTGGAEVFVWAHITEKNNASILVGEVQLSLTPSPGEDHAWLDPDMTEQVSSSSVRAALLVDERFAPGLYRLYAKVSDDPEVEFLTPVAGSLVRVK